MSGSEFRDRSVLVTGASRGIGLAVAERFAALGARVGLVSSTEQRLQEAAAGIPGTHHAVAADLTDPRECARAVDEIAAALGPIDALVSCAGALYRDFVEDVSLEDFERSYRLHVGAGLWLTQRVLPGMRERGYGRIVLVSSELGLIGGPSYASYCTSKWALVGLAEVLYHGSRAAACARARSVPATSPRISCARRLSGDRPAAPRWRRRWTLSAWRGRSCARQRGASRLWSWTGRTCGPHSR